MTTFDQARDQLIQQLTDSENTFADTLEFIEQWFEFRPTAFKNGDVNNTNEQNQGSCKVLALAELLNLSDLQTLQCFGEHYREVLATPTADNHFNLRRLVRDGRQDIHFDCFPLTKKSGAL